MLNGRFYFQAALYHTMGRFSRMRGFVDFVAAELESLPYEREPVLNYVKKLHATFVGMDEAATVDQNRALEILASRDLEAIIRVLESDSICAEIDRERDVEARLSECMEAGIDFLNTLGIKIDPVPFHIVDHLSPPYDANGTFAMNADEGDRQLYGLVPGIYFQRSLIRPIYSKYLMLHELIHTYLGQTQWELPGRGLEEGVAEILGSMYLSSKVLGHDLTHNLFIYNRLGFGQSQYLQLYLDFTRQAGHIYRQFGLDGIVALLNEGRGAIKKIENAALGFGCVDMALPKGNWDEDLSELIDVLTVTSVANFVVSPLAAYLARFVRPGLAVQEILSAANADKRSGKKALIELEERVLLAAFDAARTKVTWTDCQRLEVSEVLRYEI